MCLLGGGGEDRCLQLVGSNVGKRINGSCPSRLGVGGEE